MPRHSYREGSISEFTDIHNLICRWRDAGLIDIPHNVDVNDWILNLFEFEQVDFAMSNLEFLDWWDRRRAAVSNLSWLLGPHGLTLLKAKMIRNETA